MYKRSRGTVVAGFAIETIQLREIPQYNSDVMRAKEKTQTVTSLFLVKLYKSYYIRSDDETEMVATPFLPSFGKVGATYMIFHITNHNRI